VKVEIEVVLGVKSGVDESNEESNLLLIIFFFFIKNMSWVLKGFVICLSSDDLGF